MRKKALLSAALTATMLTGMLTGCGNESEDPTPTPSPKPTEATSTPEPTKGDAKPTETTEPEPTQTTQPDGSEPAYKSLLEIDKLDNPNVVFDHYWNPDGRDSFEMAAIRRYEEKYRSEEHTSELQSH